MRSLQWLIRNLLRNIFWSWLNKAFHFFPRTEFYTNWLFFFFFFSIGCQFVVWEVIFLSLLSFKFIDDKKKYSLIFFSFLGNRPTQAKVAWIWQNIWKQRKASSQRELHGSLTGTGSLERKVKKPTEYCDQQISQPFNNIISQLSMLIAI